jgi:O-acetylserine/cysteine efflux transporter
MILLGLIGVSVFQACWSQAMARTAPSLGSIGIVIAFAGVVLVVNNSLTSLTLSLGGLDGTLLWVLAAFAWALYVDRGAPFNLRLGALPVMAWTTLLDLDARLGVYWLYTAIFPVGVAYLGLTAGLERLGVSRVMVYMYLIPVAGVGLSAAFFGDPLTAARVLGGLIVLLGVILTRLALDRAPRVPV